MYDIVVRFPNKEMADEFCGQMSDGFGEGLCDFSCWQKIHGIPPKKDDYVKVTTSTIQPNTPVYFINSIESF